MKNITMNLNINMHTTNLQQLTEYSVSFFILNKYLCIDDNYQCFTDIVGQINKKDWDHTEDLHLQKLNKYRNLKEY